MKYFSIFIFYTVNGFAYISNLEPMLQLTAQKNRGVQSFYAKSKIVLANDPSQELSEELWYSNKGILRSNLLSGDRLISAKITRPEKALIYGKQMKTLDDLTPSIIPGIYLFSSVDFLTKLIRDLGVPLKVNPINPQAEYVNFGYGTLLRYAPNLTDDSVNSIYVSPTTKIIVGFKTSRNGRSLKFISTKFTAIESNITYPSITEIINEDNKRIGTITLVTALANIPSPDTLTQAPSSQSQETNFWLHEWLR